MIEQGYDLDDYDDDWRDNIREQPSLSLSLFAEQERQLNELLINRSWNSITNDEIAVARNGRIQQSTMTPSWRNDYDDDIIILDNGDDDDDGLLHEIDRLAGAEQALQRELATLEATKSQLQDYVSMIHCNSSYGLDEESIAFNNKNKNKNSTGVGIGVGVGVGADDDVDDVDDDDDDADDDDDDDSLANEIGQLAEAERKLQEALAQVVEASKLQLDQQHVIERCLLNNNINASIVVEPKADAFMDEIDWLVEAERALAVHPSDSLEESKTIVFDENTNGIGDEQLMDDSNITEWQPSTDLDNHEYMEDTISCAHESSISESVPQETKPDPILSYTRQGDNIYYYGSDCDDDDDDDMSKTGEAQSIGAISATDDYQSGNDLFCGFTCINLGRVQTLLPSKSANANGPSYSSSVSMEDDEVSHIITLMRPNHRSSSVEEDKEELNSASDPETSIHSVPQVVQLDIQAHDNDDDDGRRSLSETQLTWERLSLEAEPAQGFEVELDESSSSDEMQPDEQGEEQLRVLATESGEEDIKMLLQTRNNSDHDTVPDDEWEAQHPAAMLPEDETPRSLISGESTSNRHKVGIVKTLMSAPPTRVFSNKYVQREETTDIQTTPDKKQDGIFPETSILQKFPQTDSREEAPMRWPPSNGSARDAMTSISGNMQAVLCLLYQDTQLVQIAGNELDQPAEILEVKAPSAQVDMQASPRENAKVADQRIEPFDVLGVMAQHERQMVDQHETCIFEFEPDEHTGWSTDLTSTRGAMLPEMVDKVLDRIKHIETLPENDDILSKKPEAQDRAIRLSTDEILSRMPVNEESTRDKNDAPGGLECTKFILISDNEHVQRDLASDINTASDRNDEAISRGLPANNGMVLAKEKPSETDSREHGPIRLPTSNDGVRDTIMDSFLCNRQNGPCFLRQYAQPIQITGNDPDQAAGGLLEAQATIFSHVDMHIPPENQNTAQMDQREESIQDQARSTQHDIRALPEKGNIVFCQPETYLTARPEPEDQSRCWPTRNGNLHEAMKMRACTQLMHDTKVASLHLNVQTSPVYDAPVHEKTLQVRTTSSVHENQAPPARENAGHDQLEADVSKSELADQRMTSVRWNETAHKEMKVKACAQFMHTSDNESGLGGKSFETRSTLAQNNEERLQECEDMVLDKPEQKTTEALQNEKTSSSTSSENDCDAITDPLCDLQIGILLLFQNNQFIQVPDDKSDQAADTVETSVVSSHQIDVATREVCFVSSGREEGATLYQREGDTLEAVVALRWGLSATYIRCLVFAMILCAIATFMVHHEALIKIIPSGHIHGSS